MVNSVDRSGPAIRPTAPRPDSAQAPKAKIAAFDPLKESKTPRPQTEDAFSLAQKEAYDNDTQEAQDAAALGKMAGRGRGLDTGADVRDVAPPEHGRAVAHQRSAGEEDAEAGSLGRSQGRSTATEMAGPEAAKALKAVDIDTSTVAERHDNLMMLSSSLGREQVATHISHEAADRVNDILESAMWSRSEQSFEDLTTLQMEKSA